MRYREILLLFLLTLFFQAAPFAQETADPAGSGDSVLDLSISPEDTLVIPSADGGFDLFIRKKSDTVSVALTEFTPAAIEQGEELYEYRTNVKNRVNGDERYREYGNRIFKNGGIWRLVDSTTESFRFTEGGAEEQAFHIYLPTVLYYGYHDTRSGIVDTVQGLHINIRCFSAPFADIRSHFTDNFFVLTVDDPGHPRLEPFAIKEVVPVDEDKPSLAPQPVEPHGEKPFLLEAEAGFMYFTPGAEGGNLRKTLGVPVRVSFKAPLSEKWSAAVGYEWDPLLLNRLFVRAASDLGPFNISAGLAAGFLNFDPAIISLAFSTALFVQSPGGRVFGSLRLDFPFNRAQEDSTSSYEQTYFALDAGVKLPFIVLSLNTLFLVMRSRDGKEVWNVSYSTSKQTRYALTIKTDLTGPWNFSLTAGYRELSRTDKTLFLPDTYRYTSFFGDAGVFFRVNRDLEFFVKGNAPFYPWVFNPLPAQSNAFLFTASLGVVMRLGNPR
jgi:hypothetical protein